MFGAKQQKLRREYDDRLLETIERVKEEWDHAKQTELAVADVDEEITSQASWLGKNTCFYTEKPGYDRSTAITSKRQCLTSN
ncbi:YaaL family protein [Secundilactobacillus similis]|uniref:YaaL family protein n=1 Tax=Secundilactobacillus similis TaxID=414682 RepID=UPI000A7486D9